MIFSRSHNDSLSRAEIGALYDKHAPWLLAVCMRYTGNREDAEDVLHEGFMKVIRSIKEFKNDRSGGIEAWMRRIMVNTALNYIRDHKKEKMFTSLGDEHTLVVEDEEYTGAGGSDLSKEQLMGLVCELPSGYRTVFNLYVMEDYSHKEIAGMLGISENTSKTQLMKARRMLQEKLGNLVKELNYERTTSDR
jgi:RNA polymerase sigma-70 factor (ECF subfamily)